MIQIGMLRLRPLIPPAIAAGLPVLAICRGFQNERCLRRHVVPTLHEWIVCSITGGRIDPAGTCNTSAHEVLLDA